MTTSAIIRSLLAATLIAAGFAVFLADGAPVTAAGSGAPLAVAVILDTSGSMAGPRMVEAKKGVAQFFDTLGTRIEAGLLSFDQCDATVNAPLSTQQGATLAASQNTIARLEATSQTPIVTSYRKAHDLLKASAAGQKGILLVTDGMGNCADEESFCLLSRAYAKQGVQTVVVGYLLDPSAVPNFTCNAVNLYYGVDQNTPPDQYGRRLIRALFRARREFLSHVDDRYLKGVFVEADNPVCMQKAIGQKWMLMELSEVRDLAKKKSLITAATAVTLEDFHPVQPGGTLAGAGKVEVGAEDLYRVTADGVTQYYLDVYKEALKQCRSEEPFIDESGFDDMMK